MPDLINIDLLADAICRKLEDRGRIVPRLLSLEQAAAYLGLTEPALRFKATTKQVPAVHVDKKWRFDREDLDRWIEEHKEVA